MNEFQEQADAPLTEEEKRREHQRQTPYMVAPSRLRTRGDKLLLYYQALTAGDPATVAKARKEREMADMAASDDGDDPLVADDAWKARREAEFQVASDMVWDNMSDSDLARESLAARTLPPAPQKRPDKRALFPQPGVNEQVALMGSGNNGKGK
jgi:hypothetical protein